ncbi:hypothetical protein ABK040_010296 [Willaertia magna]
MFNNKSNMDIDENLLEHHDHHQSVEEDYTVCFDTLCNPDIPSTKKENIKQQIIKHVKEEKLSLNESVKFLGPYLNNSQDERIRSCSYEILNEILINLPINKSNDEQKTITIVASLLRFISDRFYDIDCISTLLPCLLTIFTKYSSFISFEQSSQTMILFFENVSLEKNGIASATKIRKFTYDWFKALLESFPKVVGTINFMNGFIQTMDGERDPLNLLFCFDFIPKLIKLIKQEHLEQSILLSCSEELFEITSCYFPITYNPSPNDTRGITKEQLSTSLKECFASNEYFASFLFPFLLEKISSDIIDTKIEALDYLSYCIEKFGEEIVREYLTEIWAYIRTEVLRTGSIDVLKKCYESVTRITKIVLNKKPTTKFDLPNIEAIIRPCLVELKSPTESKFSALYSRLIYSCTCASFEIAILVFERIVPELIFIGEDASTKDKKSGILLMFTQLLQGLMETITCNNTLPESILKYINQMMDIFKQIYDEEYKKDERDLILIIIEALSRIIVFYNINNNENYLFDTSILSEIYINQILLRHKILTHMGTDDTELGIELNQSANLDSYKERTIKAIAWIYQYKPKLIEKEIIEVLIKKLNENNDLSVRIEIIETISSVALNCPKLDSIIIERLFERITFLISLLKDTKEIEEERRKVFEVLIRLDVGQLESSQIVNYIQRMITFSNGTEIPTPTEMIDDDNDLKEEGVTRSDISTFCNLLMRQLSEKEQQFILDELFNNISLLTTLTNDNLRKFISVFSSVIIACRPTIQLPNTVELFRTILNIAIDEKSVFEVSSSCSQIIGSILNKIEMSSNEFNQIINICTNHIYEPLMNAVASNEVMNINTNYLEALGWIVKGLVMRGANKPYGDNYSKLLCGCLTSSFGTGTLFNKKAADCFLIVMGETENSLHKNNYANYQVLYKQRFFTVNIKVLLDNIKTSDRPDIIGSILLAVSHLIHNVSTNVILSEVNNIFPIVLRFLESMEISDANTELLYAAVKTTNTLLTDAKSEMVYHLDSIIPLLLQIATYPKSQAVRLLAIQSLRELTNGFEYSHIHPFKKIIIKGLEPCLDDKKRNVRKEAVECRNDFFVLNYKENTK